MILYRGRGVAGFTGIDLMNNIIIIIRVHNNLFNKVSFIGVHFIDEPILSDVRCILKVVLSEGFFLYTGSLLLFPVDSQTCVEDCLH